MEKTIMVSNVIFTHLWVDGKGWQPTIYRTGDFQVVSHWGANEKDGEIFVCDSSRGYIAVLKGSFEEVSPIYGKVIFKKFAW